MSRPSDLANYRDLFDRTNEVILLLDPDSFVIMDANAACESRLGLAAEAVLGQQIENFVHKDKREEFLQALRVSRRRYHPREFETLFVSSGHKSIPMQVVTCGLKLSDERLVLQLIFKDISAQREAEQRLEGYVRALKEANQQLEVLSMTDELTGLPNVRYFKSHLTSYHEEAALLGLPYSIVFVDVDNFKHYNDRNGHPAGDDLLRQISKVMRFHCRGKDIIARYGGEEFVILCTETPENGAATFAERLRKAIEKTPFPHAQYQPLGKVSVSIGVASYPDHASTPDQILSLADQCLYVSKHSGRNRVTAHSMLKEVEKA